MSFDEEDASITRSDTELKRLFAIAGLSAEAQAIHKPASLRGRMRYGCTTSSQQISELQFRDPETALRAVAFVLNEVDIVGLHFRLL